MESKSSGKKPSGPPRKPAAKQNHDEPLDVAGVVNAIARLTEFKSRQTSEEVEAKLYLEEKAAEYERWREKFILIASTHGLLSIFDTCLFVALRSENPDVQKWAMGIVATMVTGIVGFLSGLASKG